jgi:S-sulfo-L-cysteine synthase (O-acetyl-L-serine-dependent)
MSWKSKTDTFPEIVGTNIQRKISDPSSILAAIGHTPLLEIRNIPDQNENVRIFAKAEWFNPGGSIKDRPALNMLLEGEKTGKLTRNKTIIDATSGNTGIAYAMIGSALGYKVMLAIPSNASLERKKTLRAYGAEIIETDPLAGTDGAQELVREMVEAEPGRYFYPDQYNNPSNWLAHYNSTAIEIWNQTKGRVTHFVAGLGTTGTFIGISRRLKELNPSISCISFQPDSPLHGLEGLKHLPTSIVPGIYDATIADDRMTVSTDDAYKMMKFLAKNEGMFVGVSSGASLAASFRLASEISAGSIVTVFPDGGARYSGEHFWDEKK